MSYGRSVDVQVSSMSTDVPGVAYSSVHVSGQRMILPDPVDMSVAGAG